MEKVHKEEKITLGKKTVLILSDKGLSDDNIIRLGKELSYCPKN